MMLRAATRMLSPAGDKGRLTILIFHRVHDRVDPLYPDEPDLQRFSQIVGWVGRWFKVLPLERAVQRLRDGALPAGAAAITFDDGYADNERNAMPILQRHGMCATFFVASDFLDGGRMWNDSVVEAVRACSYDALDLREHGLGHHPLQNVEAKRRVIGNLLQQIKYRAPAERSQVVNVIAQAAGVSLPDDLMMSSAQLRSLRQGGMEIGAHTCSHPILTRLDEATARTEIQQGKQRLESVLQEPVRLFAYPNGKPEQDYAQAHVSLVRNLGFDAAVSTAPGAASKHADLFQLPRFTPWDKSAWRYGARLLKNLHAPIAMTSNGSRVQ